MSECHINHYDKAALSILLVILEKLKNLTHFDDRPEITHKWLQYLPSFKYIQKLQPKSHSTK